MNKVDLIVVTQLSEIKFGLNLFITKQRKC